MTSKSNTKTSRTLVDMFRVKMRGHQRRARCLKMLIALGLLTLVSLSIQQTKAESLSNQDYENNQEQGDFVSAQNRAIRRPNSEISRSQEQIINQNSRQQPYSKRDVESNVEESEAGSQPPSGSPAEGAADSEDDEEGGGGDTAASVDYSSATGADEGSEEVPVATTSTARPAPQQVAPRRQSQPQPQTQSATSQPPINLMAGHRNFLSTTPRLVMQPLSPTTRPPPSSISSGGSQPQASHSRVERHQANFALNSQPATLTTPVATTMVSVAPLAHRFNGNHQVASSTATPSPRLSLSTSPATTAATSTSRGAQQPAITFSVGPELMSINRQQQQQTSGSATNFAGRTLNSNLATTTLPTTTIASSTTSSSNEANMMTSDALDQANSDHLMLENHHYNGRQAPQHQQTNERRQDLLYPQASSFQESTYRPPNSLNGYPLDQSDPNFQVPTICYTPLALLMVILASVLVTVVVCFCTHVLIKYLSRHQFDLIENSKNFHNKHAGYSLGGANQRSPNQRQASWSVPQTISTGQLHLQEGASSGGPADTTTTTLATSGYASHQQPDHCAFDNPYFSGGGGIHDEITRAESHWQQPHQMFASKQLAGGLLTQAPYSGELHHSNNHHNNHHHHHHQLQQVGVLATGADGSDERPLNFIENHISNLHSRQVTSSVSELGKSAGTQVVDLTSEEQRARIIANPREGDLVAVDITGHDFIGLGFDVCGGPQEGVFIRTVLSRGPARESGCVEPGDRIKCLNISFENITLEDAYDILNCGAPYKMRLLLEKRILPEGHHLLSRSRSPAPHLCGGSGLRIAARQQQASHYQLNGSEEPLTGGGYSGPLSATRTYLKRLTSKLVAPAGGSNISPSSTSSVSQLHQVARPSNQTAAGQYQAPQLNGGHYKQQDPYNLQQQQQMWSPVYSPDNNDDHYRMEKDSRSSEVVQGQISEAHENAGFSGESDTEIAPELRADLNRGESFEYKSKNAGHKLHGPGYNGQLSKYPPKLDQIHDGADPPRRAAGNPARSHSMADALAHTNGHLDADLLAKTRKHLVDAHLDQSQSQPEIAHLDLRRIGEESSELDAAAAAADDDVDVAGAGNGNIKSVSTPAVNLIPGGNLNQPAAWRISTRRNKRANETAKETVREEESTQANDDTTRMTTTSTTTTTTISKESRPPA